jgi:light-regulated signal transduction histidine kinase (bacteriophytochrome)
MTYSMGHTVPGDIDALRQQIEELKGRVAELETSEAALREENQRLSELLQGFSEQELKFREALLASNEETRTLNTELEKRVEERTADLRRSNEDLQQFAYVSSHDLQEPLRTIISYTQLLEHRYSKGLDADAREFMSYIVDAAQRMSVLIHDLLSYSRVVNVESLPLRPVSITGVVEAARLNLLKAIDESAASLTYDDLPNVLGDETRLGQLFQNLIGNAIKYRGPDPPKIHISAEDRGDEWLFSVSDNGIGIDPAYHERVFGLFKRLHGRDVPGTGLGLAICRKIAEKHHGKIWVESELGKGSVFRFTLPA